ncbi:MAG: diguanylate cyclase [Lachnospiraceae bacterium]|jgi:diguanylate cyclase (GGDEF)-like protein|nr:diguanylate cyclase [Lachnospiraceae bacterium]
MPMKQILIVDDVKTNIKIATEALKGNYQVSAAKTGAKAFDYLEKLRPDLILLDINLPDIDGYEFLERLQKNEKTANIPVVFLTAQTDAASEARGLKLGAMDFVKKPFVPEILANRVERVLKAEEARRTLGHYANRDSLTTLWNRRYLEEYIEKGAGRQEKGVFLLLDMDNFKQVNDNYGHLMGDDVLIAFAKTLQEYSGDESRVCRIGCDVFVIYLSNVQSKAKISEMASNLIADIEHEVNKSFDFEQDIRISVSIGIALKPQDGKDFMSLYNCADKALYFVKQNGKKGYHFFHDTDGSGQMLLAHNRQIELMQLRRSIRESETAHGEYRVEFSGFNRIYRFVARFVENTGQSVQMVLFTIGRSSGVVEDGQMSLGMEKAMTILEDAASASLRSGDVGSRFSGCQYVAVLMDVSSENVTMIVERILVRCKEELDSAEFTLRYEIEELKSST